MQIIIIRGHFLLHSLGNYTIYRKYFVYILRVEKSDFFVYNNQLKSIFLKNILTKPFHTEFLLKLPQLINAKYRDSFCKISVWNDLVSMFLRKMDFTWRRWRFDLLFQSTANWSVESVGIQMMVMVIEQSFPWAS